MSVYTSDGIELNAVFGKDGSEVIDAYDYNGGLVYTKYEPDPNSPVGIHGKLRKYGKYLVDKNNRQMEIRAIGTHHLLQYSNLHTVDAIGSLKSYGVNCLRICAYLEDWDFVASDGETAYGYISHPTETKAEIEKLIDICVSLGMYIILDWHVLGNGTNGQSAPTGVASLHQSEAEEFFAYYSRKYANLPNMMYELANEPYNVTASQCMPFVKSIRSIILSNVANPVMIMNTASNYSIPTIYNAMSAEGITDVFTSAHQYGLNRVSQYTGWWDSGYPLFNTEWGVLSIGDGNTSNNAVNATAMLEFYHTTGVPHGVWKYTDQTVDSAFLKNLGSINSPTYADGFDDSDLSVTGTLFLKKFQSYATTDYIERDIIE